MILIKKSLKGDYMEFKSRKSKKTKIGFVASRGGHLSELEFMEYMSPERESFLLTEKHDLQSERKVYFVEPINRHERFAIFKIIPILLREMIVLMKERPDYIITTGALISIPILLLGKMTGKRTIYVESLARIEDLSVSGKIAYHFVDLFIVYWENLKKLYPKSVYINIFKENGNDLCDSGDTEVPV